jgi:hypothetical protein
MGGWLDEWMDGCKSHIRDCLQQLKTTFVKISKIMLTSKEN